MSKPIDSYHKVDEEGSTVSAVFLQGEGMYYKLTTVSGQDFENVDTVLFASHREAQLAFQEAKRKL